MKKWGIIIICFNLWAQNPTPLLLNEVVLEAPLMTTTTHHPYALTLIQDSLGLQMQQNIGQQLQGIPSLFASSQQNFSQDTRISIRGFGARAPFGIRGIRLLLNGIPLTTPDGQTQIDHIPLPLIHKIEVLRGISSGLYGNASGGVILLKTKPVEASEVQLESSLGSGNFKVLNGLVSQNTDKTQWRVYLENSKADGYRDWSGYENNIIDLSINQKLAENETISLHYNHLNSPFAYDSGGLTLEEVHDNRRQARQINKGFKAQEKVNQHFVSLRYKKLVETHRNTQAYLFYNKRNLEAFLPFEYGGAVDLGRHYTGFGLRKEFHKNRQQWLVGIDAAWQSDDRERFKNLMGVRGDKTLHQGEFFGSTGLFVMHHWRLNHLFLRTGLRWDGHLIGLHDKLQNNNAKNFFDALSPVLSFEWNGIQKLKIFARYAQGFETPTLNELSANPTGDTGFNENLGLQFSKEFEWGLRHQTEHFSLQLLHFITQTQGEILPYELEEFPNQSFYANLEETTRKGLELELAWLPNQKWLLKLSGSHGRYQINENQRSLPNIPETQGFLRIQYNTTENSLLSLHVGAQSQRFANAENSVTVPAAHQLDVVFQKRWKNLWLTFGINNLTDFKGFDNIRVNAFGKRYYEPAAGRQYFGRLILKIPCFTSKF